MPQCGFARSDNASNGAVVAVGPEEPVFPIGIFLMIAKHLQPGTAAFLNLARSCRTLYQFLAPSHFEDTLTNVSKAYPITKYSVRRGPKVSDLPHGLGLTRRLDVSWDRGKGLDLEISLIVACPNITELVCSWKQLEWLILRHRKLVKHSLKQIEFLVKERDARFDPGLWAGLPNVTGLVIYGTPSKAATRFFERNCPRLETVELNVDDIGWNPRHLDTTFVSKIRKCSFCNVDLMLSMIRTQSSFAPEEIEVTRGIRDLEIEDSYWPALVGLTSLKRLKLNELVTRTLHPSGFPPNLEELCVEFMKLDVRDETNLAGLAALLRSARGKVRFDMLFVPGLDLEPEKRRMLLSELAIWSEMNGFRTKQSVEQIETLWRMEGWSG